MAHTLGYAKLTCEYSVHDTLKVNAVRHGTAKGEVYLEASRENTPTSSISLYITPTDARVFAQTLMEAAGDAERLGR